MKNTKDTTNLECDSHYQKAKIHISKWLNDLPEFKIEPGKITFWRNLFLVFIFTGIVGKFVDISWRILTGTPYESWVWQLWPIMAEPEAIGGVLLVLLLYPLIYKKKVNLAVIYLLATILVTLVELVIGFILIISHGGINPYWDYSHMPLNFIGQISLSQSLAFGFAAMFFVYVVFPIFYTFISRKSAKLLNRVAIFLALWYGLSLVSQLITGFRLLI